MTKLLWYNNSYSFRFSLSWVKRSWKVAFNSCLFLLDYLADYVNPIYYGGTLSTLVPLVISETSLKLYHFPPWAFTHVLRKFNGHSDHQDVIYDVTFAQKIWFSQLPKRGIHFNSKNTEPFLVVIRISICIGSDFF